MDSRTASQETVPKFFFAVPDKLRIFAHGLSDYTYVIQNYLILGRRRSPFLFLYCWLWICLPGRCRQPFCYAARTSAPPLEGYSLDGKLCTSILNVCFYFHLSYLKEQRIMNPYNSFVGRSFRLFSFVILFYQSLLF